MQSCVPTSVNELTENNSSVNLYPNPIKELLHIISDKEIQKLEMTNLTGQVLFSESVAHFEAFYAA